MTYEIIRIAKGKEEVVEEGSLRKMNGRLKQLRGGTTRGVSGRGGKKYPVTYKVRFKNG